METVASLKLAAGPYQIFTQEEFESSLEELFGEYRQPEHRTSDLGNVMAFGRTRVTRDEPEWPKPPARPSKARRRRRRRLHRVKYFVQLEMAIE